MIRGKVKRISQESDFGEWIEELFRVKRSFQDSSLYMKIFEIVCDSYIDSDFPVVETLWQRG